LPFCRWICRDLNIAVRTLTPNRFLVTLLLSGFLSFAWTSPASAQDASDAPLGDVARNFRKKSAPPTPTVIHVDDDNLSKAMDDAAARRASGASVFSLDAQKNDAQKNDAQKNDPLKKRFDLSSPDVSCSLNFTAKTTSPFSDSLLVDDLPRAELAKLDGPAIIDGDSLQVSLHNGTAWELREVVIGLTIVRQSVPSEAASINRARIVPAAGTQTDQDSYQKQPDVTMLLHVKGSAPSSTTAIFRTPLNFALFPDQEWHWAIVRAKGIPPQTPPELTTLMQSQASQPVTAPPAPETKLPPPLPAPSNKTSSSPDAATH
jgi:hypothetical protein